MSETFFLGWQAAMLQWALKSLLLFALLGSALLLMRRASAAMRHLACLLTLTGVLLLPVFTGALPARTILLRTGFIAAPPMKDLPALPVMPPPNVYNQVPLSGDEKISEASLPIPTVLPRKAGVTSSIPTAQPIQPTAGTEAPRPKPLSLPTVVFALWLTGTCLLSGLGILRLAQIGWFARKCARLTAPTLLVYSQQWSREMGVNRPVTLLACPPGSRLMSPVTWGFWKPVVLLPSEAESWPEDRLRAVLLHEFSHIQRGDWPAQILASLICACFWFHPLVWLTAKRMRIESERACDDRVLACGMTAQDYAAHLLAIVRSLQQRNRNLPAAISMAQPSQMEGRLKAILDLRCSHRLLSSKARLLTGLCAFLLLMPLAVVRVSAKDTSELTATPEAISQAAGEGKKNISRIQAIEYERSQAKTQLLQSQLKQTKAIINNLALKIARLPLPTTEEEVKQKAFLGKLLTDYERKAVALQRQLQQKPSETQSKPAIQSKENAMNIAWGKQIHGLQAGLRLAEGTESRISNGQRVKMEVLLRNVGNKPMTISCPGWPAEMAWNGLVENGSHAQIWREPAQRAPVIKMTLAAGEERLLPGPAPAFQIRPMGNSTVTEPTLLLEPGKRTLRAVPFLTTKSRQDDWMRRLQTGTLELEVLPAPQNSAVKMAFLPAQADRGNSALNGVDWGAKSDSGLQAGIRIESRRRRFAIGEEIPLTAFVRNTSRDQEIAFAYTYKWPDAWDEAGKPVSTMRNTTAAGAGIPGAILLILKPGETLMLPGEKLLLLEKADGVLDASPSLIAPQPGKYRLGQGIFYGINPPAAFINGKWDRAVALKVAREQLDNKQRPPYEVTVLSRTGEMRKEHAVVVAAHIYNILADNKPYVTPLLNALAADAERLWTGTPTFEIMAKPAPDEAKLPAISWGEAKEGLQAGIHLLGNRRRFTEGETVPLECYIRNVSGHDIVCVYQGNFYTDVPDLEMPDGKIQKTQGVILTGIPVLVMVKLQPGETMQVPHPGLTIGNTVGKAHDALAAKRERGLEAYPFMEQTQPGRYQILQTIRADALNGKDIPAGNPAIGTLKTRIYSRDGQVREVEARMKAGDTLSLSLTTGKNEFEIVPKGTLQEAGRADMPVVEKVDGSSGILWGNVKNGLEGGVRFHSGKNRYSPGETVRIDYMVRNAGTKPITFGYNYWEGVTNYSPRIVDPHGDEVPITGGYVTFKPTYKTQTLNPGEMIAIGHSSLKLHEENMSRAKDIELGIFARPGLYKISLPGFLHPDNDLKKTRITMSVPLEFEVVKGTQ